LLSQIFQRLKLKEKDATCVSDTKIAEMWEELKSIDSECDDPQSLKTKSAVTENKSIFVSLLSRTTLLF